MVPVDINLTGDRASTSGCEAADFAGLNFGGANDIALIQRGTCTFAEKAVNAEAAGAEAVIIFNQGNDPDPPRADRRHAGAHSPAEITIPVVGASFANGAALAQPGSTAYVRVLPPETRTDVNVIAELPGKNDDNVVMAGAHLDSVTAGPGINDNGSGSAALLETALMMAKLKPENTVRFAWWGAEEDGLIGSTAYVDELSQAERDRIALYMNYDMVGSPNYIFMVYDADQSTFEAPVPFRPARRRSRICTSSTTRRRRAVRRHRLLRAQRLPGLHRGRASPSGGLCSPAPRRSKTAEQQAIWGGTTGAQFDPCYHLACDTFDNINVHALEVNSDLIAFAQLTFAYSTRDGQRRQGQEGARRSPDVPPGAGEGPEGTFTP